MNKRMLVSIAILASVSASFETFALKRKGPAANPAVSSASNPVVQAPQGNLQVISVVPQNLKIDANAIIQEVMQEEIKILKSNLLEMLLEHPILGTQKELAIQTIEALRTALIGLENDQKIQALPTKAQFAAQIQTAPKRELTKQEENFLLSAAVHKKSADVYPMYLQMRPDVMYDAIFAEEIDYNATSHPITFQEEADLLHAAASWPREKVQAAYSQYLKIHKLVPSPDLFRKVLDKVYRNK